MAYLTHRPAAGRLVQGYGPRPKPTPTSPAIHNGQDYGWVNSRVAGVGDVVRAARAGRVSFAGSSGAYGQRIVVDHGSGHMTAYCHLHPGTFVVTVGDQVVGGQVLAAMGASGNVTAKHLHFMLLIGGAPVDPASYFTTGAGDIGTPLPPAVEREDEAMYFLKPQLIIVWPNGFAKAYDAAVFEACRLVAEDGDRESSRVATFVRESWVAADFMIARAAAAIDGVIDDEAILAKVSEAHPAPELSAEDLAELGEQIAARIVIPVGVTAAELADAVVARGPELARAVMDGLHGRLEA